VLRAVLDANVLIAALISPGGTPAEALRRWGAGAYDLVVSEKLLDEIDRALNHPKLRTRVSEADAQALLRSLREEALVASDPSEPFRVRTADPDDDYLLALAAQENAVLVSGDAHLLAEATRAPVVTPRELLDRLDA
jgi:putative PIN family toxin of toxin-antitoxin system